LRTIVKQTGIKFSIILLADDVTITSLKKLTMRIENNSMSFT